MKYEILQMLKQGDGSIVNTSSAYGLVGGYRLPAYIASKHGVVGITRGGGVRIRAEWYPRELAFVRERVERRRSIGSPRVGLR